METTMRDILIKAYNLGSLSTDKQDTIIGEIGSLIFQAILIRIIPILNESQQEKLEEILSVSSGPDDLLAFLNKEVPNFAEIVAEEAEKFKKDNDAIMSKIG